MNINVPIRNAESGAELFLAHVSQPSKR